MFENVLVGVDGSSYGRDAIALAPGCSGDGGRLTLVHVHQGRLHPLHAVTPGLVAEERAASEKLLLDERERAGVEAELVSATGASPGGDAARTGRGAGRRPDRRRLLPAAARSGA